MSNDEPLLRREYVIALALFAVVCFSLGDMRWLRQLWHSASPARASKGSVEAGSDPAGESDNRNLQADLADFYGWLSGQEAVVVRIPRTDRVVEQPGTNGPPADVSVHAWFVPIEGTIRTGGGWKALYGGCELAAGDRIAPRKAGECGYQVLSVGRRCVWLASETCGDVRDLAGVAWPDDLSIRLGTTPPFAPVLLEFGGIRALSENDKLVHERTGASFVIEEMWPEGVHFSYHPPGGGCVLDIVCIVRRQ